MKNKKHIFIIILIILAVSLTLIMKVISAISSKKEEPIIKVDNIKPSLKPIVTKPIKVIKKPKKPKNSTVIGAMNFIKNGDDIIVCYINDKDIPVDWCEPFYPLPENNNCEASFSTNNKIINLMCK